MTLAGLVPIIVYLIIIGLVVYLIDLIPMDIAIKRIIRVIIIIAVVIWLLQVFGLIGSFHDLLHPPTHPIH